MNSRHSKFVDVVGTGGSGVKSFNVSTAAVFVVAGAGLPVAKHGNRAATSASGSADVLQELGVDHAASAAVAEDCLEALGICFMFAPVFHSLPLALANARRRLAMPTIFNNLGPLCNPAGAPYQVIGVWHKKLLKKTASALLQLGTERSWVVHGCNGLDEISISGPSMVTEIKDGALNEFVISPSDFGIKEGTVSNYSKPNPAESARTIKAILNGECAGEDIENLVLINAAAALLIAGLAADLRTAFEMATESVRSGAAKSKLIALVRKTNDIGKDTPNQS